MSDINIIDQFTETFIRYVDGGFGLLSGEVGFLTSVIVGIDIVMAGLFWAWDERSDVIQSLVKKILYVGFFALILNQFGFLSDVIFKSFTGLGLVATGSPLSADDLLRPGFVAATGFDAAHPIIDEIRTSFGFTDLLSPLSMATALVLIFAWLLVILSFFVLSIQLFVTIIEFKLTTLAGFVLVPFALWRGTSFLAERVLGAVISAGIKMMVLAVVTGIGTTLFSTFTGAFGTDPVEMEDAMVLVLASLSLVGLSVFAPGIATGLVSGAPQLGAGAAVATVGGVAAASMAGAGLALGAARVAGGAALGAAKAASSTAGTLSTGYTLAKNTSGASGTAGTAAGLGGAAKAGAGALTAKLKERAARPVQGLKDAFGEGQAAGWSATGGRTTGEAAGRDAAHAEAGRAPQWANELRRRQRMAGAAHMSREILREGDRPGAPANPTLKDGDD